MGNKQSRDESDRSVTGNHQRSRFPEERSAQPYTDERKAASVGGDGAHRKERRPGRHPLVDAVRAAEKLPLTGWLAATGAAETGTLFFKDGRVVAARSGRARGLDALRHMLSVRSGTYTIFKTQNAARQEFRNESNMDLLVGLLAEMGERVDLSEQPPEVVDADASVPARAISEHGATAEAWSLRAADGTWRAPQWAMQASHLASRAAQWAWRAPQIDGRWRPAAQVAAVASAVAMVFGFLFAGIGSSTGSTTPPSQPLAGAPATSSSASTSSGTPSVPGPVTNATDSEAIPTLDTRTGDRSAATKRAKADDGEAFVPRMSVAPTPYEKSSRTAPAEPSTVEPLPSPTMPAATEPAAPPPAQPATRPRRQAPPPQSDADTQPATRPAPDQPKQQSKDSKRKKWFNPRSWF